MRSPSARFPIQVLAIVDEMVAKSDSRRMQLGGCLALGDLWACCAPRGGDAAPGNGGGHDKYHFSDQASGAAFAACMEALWRFGRDSETVSSAACVALQYVLSERRRGELQPSEAVQGAFFLPPGPRRPSSLLLSRLGG